MATQLLRQAKVTRVTTVGVYCSISTLGPGNEFGPMTTGPFVLNMGDNVLVGQFGNEMESFTVIGPLVNYVAPSPAPVAAIYSFETVAARDLAFPTPTSPTVAYVDDDQTIYIYSDEGTPGWRKINWGINGTFTGPYTFTGDTTFSGKVLLSDATKQVNIGGSGSSASFAALRALVTDFLMTARVTSDTNNRLQIAADGKHSWGTGAAGTDTTLYRNGVGILKTDGALQSASLSTGAVTATGLSANIIPLDDLSDVAISSPAVKQVLRHNGTSWVNAQLALSDISTVSVSSPATKQVLRYNGTNWVNAQAATTDLSDVTGSPNAGDVMRWNGSAWAPLPSPSRVQVSDATQGTFTGGAYSTTLTGASALSTTFVAQGTSCRICISSFTFNAGTGTFTFFTSFQVTGSGFTTYGPNDGDAAVYQGPASGGASVERTTVVTGLTPGTTYTVTLAHKVTGTTGAWNNRRIIIDY